MRLSPVLRIGALSAAICLSVHGQNTPSNEAPSEMKGLPPRATPADYQAQAQVGTVTLAAEFTRHSAPTLQGPLSTEDYVVVETALFGPPNARIRLSADDFTLRINGKKTPLPSRPYGLVAGSLRDPEWVPPEEKEPKESKNSFKTGGSGNQVEPSTPPPPVKVPIELQRAWAQRVQKASLPEGDRPLPQAGVIFFQYRGKAENIHSLELIYAGPAGKVTLTLQP
jgi:hypothetical protein